LKEQKQVIINDAVTGKIDIATGKPYPKYKDSGVEWLGQVPEGWETRKITTVCALIIDGTHFSPNSDITGDYLYITAKNIKDTGLDLKNVTYIKSADHREIYNRCPVSRSDVLYIKDGATAGIATVNPLIEEFSLLSSVALIRTKSAILAPEYLALQFNSLKFKMHVLNNLVGGAMTRFTLEIIKRFQLLIPPILEQQQIVSYIETKTAALDLAISRTEREIALMQEYRTRLISDVVTGKIDVRDIAIPDIANIEDTIDESIEEPEGEEELETAEAEE
jgi:type I restriction enzyme S subunit